MSRATFFRGVLPVLCKNSTDLELWTGVPVDDQFSGPRQCRWSAALGKVLIGDTGNNRSQIRSSDLSFFSKVANSYSYAIDSDATHIYPCYSGNVRKYLISDYFLNVNYSMIPVPSVRMIDASGDPDYVYVTSNNATDGHGVRMVKKSTMGVVASMLATGTGDNQFTNPLGVFFVSATSKLYICEATRIVELNVTRTDGAEALTWSTSYPIAANDLYFDGTNWFVQSSTQTIKYDSSFTDGTKVAVACVGYSITGIPDQSDGNGATLCIVNNSGSCLYRRKQADLSLITTVGSSGDGSSSLFDPTFTTSSNTRIIYQFDDGFQYTTPSGTSHALSWNGFAGYSFRNAGPHRCVVRCEGGLGLVTGIDVRTDAISSLKNLSRCTNTTSLTIFDNGAALMFSLREIPRNTTYFYGSRCSKVTGNISDAPSTILTYYVSECPGILGDLTQIPANCQTFHAYLSTAITAASIAHLTAIRDLRIYSMGWSQADLTTVIDSMYTARASYTYAFPSMQIGGTNPGLAGGTAGVALPAPTTTPGDGNSNSDWSWNGTYHEPLTAKAKAYYLINGPDHGTDTFNRWSISANN